MVPSLLTSPTTNGNVPYNPLQQPIGARPIIVPEPKNNKDGEDDDNKKDGKHGKSWWKKYEHLRKYLYHTCSWIFGFYTLIVLTHLRRAIRMRYRIPSQAAFDGYIEDICMSFWCGCCSVAQMARQTCHYEEDDIATCCTATGLKQQSIPSEQQSTTNGSNTDHQYLFTAPTIDIEKGQPQQQQKQSSQMPSKHPNTPRPPILTWSLSSRF